MAFQETTFPLEVSAWEMSESYNTQITVGASGYESRNANWQDALRSFNAFFSIKERNDIDTLIAFFHSVKGRETGFLVKNLHDFAVTEEWTAVSETVTGSSQTFQLYKHYENAIGTTYDRNIIKVAGDPADSTNNPLGFGVQLRDNSVVKTYTSGSPSQGVSFGVDDTTGLVTYHTSNGGGATIEFKVETYFVPCRFDTDTLPALKMLEYYVRADDTTYSYSEVPEIPIVEVRI